MFYHEIDQKEKINTRVAFPVGILTLLIGGLIYFINNLHSLTPGFWLTTFYVALGIYSLTVILAIIFVIQAYYGYEYAYLPKATDIHAFTLYFANRYDQYSDYYKQNGVSKESYIEECVEEKIAELYKVAIDDNMELNAKKLKLLRCVGWLLVIALVAGTLSLVPYFLAKDKNNVQKIQIVNCTKEIFTKKGGNIVPNSTNIRLDDDGEQTNKIIPPPPPPDPPTLKIRRIRETFEKNKNDKSTNNESEN